MRLLGYAGWSAPVLFANPKVGFLAKKPNYLVRQCMINICLVTFVSAHYVFMCQSVPGPENVIVKHICI